MNQNSMFMLRATILNIVFFILVGCSTQGPAIIERNEKVYYRYDNTLQIETMHSGESLPDTAARYNISLDEIARINSLPTSFVASKDTDILIPLHREDEIKFAEYGNRSYLSSLKDKNSSHSTENLTIAHNDSYYGDTVQTESLDQTTSEIHLMDQSTTAEKSYSSKERSAVILKTKDNSLQLDKPRSAEKYQTPHKDTAHQDTEPVEILDATTPSEPKKPTKLYSDKAIKNSPEQSETKQATKEEGEEKIDINSLDRIKDHHEEQDDLKSINPSSKESPVAQEENLGSSSFKISNPLGISKFMWPLQGKILQRFNKEQGLEGINIAAPANSIVRAAADGKVIYIGNSVNQYGNLLIIRHEGEYLTAYAHNSQVMVKKGQQIRKGQAIAKVGQSGGVEEPQLYFSIRHGKEIIDPETNRTNQP